MRSCKAPHQDRHNLFQAILILSWPKSFGMRSKRWKQEANSLLCSLKCMVAIAEKYLTVSPLAFALALPAPLDANLATFLVLGWTTSSALRKHPPREGLRASSGPSALIYPKSFSHNYEAGLVPMAKLQINNQPNNRRNEKLQKTLMT